MTEEEYQRLLEVMRTLLNSGEINRTALALLLDLANAHTDRQGGNQVCQSPPPASNCSPVATPGVRIVSGPEPCSPLNISGGNNAPPSFIPQCTPDRQGGSPAPRLPQWSPTPICPPCTTPNIPNAGPGTGTISGSDNTANNSGTWVRCPYCNRDLHVNLRLGFVERSNGSSCSGQDVVVRLSVMAESDSQSSSSQSRSNSSGGSHPGVSFDDGSYYTRQCNQAGGRPLAQPNCRPPSFSPQNNTQECCSTGIHSCSPQNINHNSSAYNTPVNYLNPSGNLIPESSPIGTNFNNSYGSSIGSTFPGTRRTC